MADSRSPKETMQKLADDISAGRYDELHLLYAPDAVVRHPQARNASALLERRQGLKEHFERFFATGVRLRATPIRFVETIDPELAVGTFAYHGENGFGMERFDLEACFIWRVRDGLVIESQDYLSAPLAPRD